MDEPKPMRELTRIREERGLSQQGLADASGVNKATINQIERGRRSPNLETLEKLADALAVEMGDFFPKAQPPLPMLPDSPAAGAVADDERRLTYLRAWRIYIHRLVRRHLEEPPETWRDLVPLHEALIVVVEQGVFVPYEHGPTEAKILEKFMDVLKRLNEVAAIFAKGGEGGGTVVNLQEVVQRTHHELEALTA
jgi:transcriptional regulator with XRE-family HTH domain